MRLQPDALAVLASYDWPGTVRELENVLTRAMLRARPRGAGLVQLSARELDLPSADAATPAAAPPDLAASPTRPLRTAVRAFERHLVQQARAAHAGNWARAAASLGKHRSNLHHLAARLGLR